MPSCKCVYGEWVDGMKTLCAACDRMMALILCALACSR